MNEEMNREEAARHRRRQKLIEMQRRKEKQMQLRSYVRKCVPFAIWAAALFLIIAVRIMVFHDSSGRDANKTEKTENGKERESGISETINSQMNRISGNDAPNDTQKAQAFESIEPQAEVFGILKPLAESFENSRQQTGILGIIEPQAEFLENTGQTKIYAAEATADTLQVSDLEIAEDIGSSNVILIDLENNSIVAQKGARAKINPASMTKILTILVAAENIDDMNDTFTITRDITDYCFSNDCSAVGFDAGETVSLYDLFYGTILPSGADAAMGLAEYVAGSHEAFVDMMNQKLKELGLSETAHVTNCVGLYDENHYCTVYDMAIILEAALDNELCREFLTAHTYTTSKTLQHPEGITISNWFLRRIEDKDTGGEVIYAKTGYVKQSGSCAASCAASEDGKEYICVTVGANSSWKCIYDHVNLYKEFFLS